jgi:hypothetical protein
MKQPLHITCKQASFLISQQQETSVSFSDKVKLKLHLSICTTCSLFKKQLTLIQQLLNKHKASTTILSNEQKQTISSQLKKEMEKP